MANYLNFDVLSFVRFFSIVIAYSKIYLSFSSELIMPAFYPIEGIVEYFAILLL